MPQTPNNINVPADEWINLNDAAGLNTGDYFLVINSSVAPIRFQESNTQPADNDDNGFVLREEDVFEIKQGSLPVWVKTRGQVSGWVSIQTIPNITPYQSGLPQDILTTDTSGVRRLAVDSQQTSYEQNTQFRYFDVLTGIAYTEQVVYKITITNPINLFLRRLSLWQGGRTYKVYADGQVNFTGTLGNHGIISKINQNLNKHITVHPDSGVVIQRANGTGILTINTDPSTTLPYEPFDGLIALTDGNANRASSELDAEGDKLGYSSNQIAWVVLDPIGANNTTNGFFKLKWEELY